MTKHLAVIIVAITVLLALAVFTVAFTVDELTDIVLVQRFGRITKVYHGKADAGLKFKWIFPVEEVVRYDARTFVFEDMHEQIQTNDKQNLLVTVFCFWRIDADQAEKFYSKNRGVDDARDKLRTILREKKKSVISRHPMSDFVNTQPNEMKLDNIEDDILKAVKKQAKEDFGVEVVMVGIKSLALPKAITQTVIESMKEERQKFVKEYEEEGKAQAMAIRDNADSMSRQIVDFARRKAKDIESEGYRSAALEYKKFRQNPRLGMFLRYLDTMRNGLKDKTEIFLDGSNIWSVRFLREGPSLPPKKPLAATKDKPDKKKSK